MTEPQWVCSEDRSRWMVLATSLIYVYVCIYINTLLLLSQPAVLQPSTELRVQHLCKYDIRHSLYNAFAEVLFKCISASASSFRCV